MRLFDLKTDPKQLSDRSRDEPDVARDLKNRLLAHVRDAASKKPVRVLGAGSATMDMLRNVGYVGGDEGADPDAHEPSPADAKREKH
jgi:hypothetical protein